VPSTRESAPVILSSIGIVFLAPSALGTLGNELRSAPVRDLSQIALE
jgi:hypothetical protein